MTRLAEQELTAALEERTNWSIEEDMLTRTYEFADFVAAIAFVDQVAAAAEEAQHHPDIDIRYNRVRITLTTHDDGGISDKDLQLADRLDRLA